MDRRLRHAAQLYCFFIFGVFLVVAPWSLIWDHMVVSISPSGLAGVLRTGWVRGAASGLGVLDLLLALQQVGLLAPRIREG
ncbi:MAG: hypothetical protein IFK94_13120 [Acidobacteria bacterium]|uniref:Uncharacterized protein n=1 Tax=Candidatus Polarisedimenticola svalbardensis TaxID=2886004 RepID=A0A8J7CM72_9BACT|nr:hypothetical protein [Candidatus Polarisedimenticola svalbardensis]